MDLGEDVLTALLEQAHREGLSVTELVERIVLRSARQRIMDDLALIEEISERSRRTRGQPERGKILMFVRPVRR